MDPRSFVKLLWVSLIFAVLAVIAWVRAPTYSAGVFFGEKLLPDFIPQVNDISVMSIEHGGQTVTFVRDALGNWTLMEAENYPADKERIRNTLIGISELEKVEPKTALEEFYADIGVEDASLPDSGSYLVTLLDAEGKERLALLVGRSARGVRWDGTGHFVRFPADKQSWLVRGFLDVTGDARTWIDTRLFPQDFGPLSSLIIADGTKEREIIFSRRDEGKPLEAEYRSDDYFVKDPEFIAETEKVLKGLNFRDVARKPENLKESQPFLFVRAQTFSGVGMMLTFHLLGNKPFVEVTADAEKSAETSLRKAAVRLAARHEGWLYQVSPEDVSALFPFMALPSKAKKAATTKPVRKEKEQVLKRPSPKAPSSVFAEGKEGAAPKKSPVPTVKAASLPPVSKAGKKNGKKK